MIGLLTLKHNTHQQLTSGQPRLHEVNPVPLALIYDSIKAILGI